MVRPVPEAPKSAGDIKEPERDMYKRTPTDDHKRELHTLFDLVSSASSGERHSDKTRCGTSVWCRRRNRNDRFNGG